MRIITYLAEICFRQDLLLQSRFRNETGQTLNLACMLIAFRTLEANSQPFRQHILLLIRSQLNNSFEGI